MPVELPDIVHSARRSSLAAAISSTLPNSNNPNAVVSGFYGSMEEPIRPTTRTLQRHIMERTISDILSDLEYAIFRKEEYRDKCQTLYVRIAKLEDQVEELKSFNFKVRMEKLEFDKNFGDLKSEYKDLHERYQKLYSKYVLLNDEVTLSDLI